MCHMSVDEQRSQNYPRQIANIVSIRPEISDWMLSNFGNKKSIFCIYRDMKISFSEYVLLFIPDLLPKKYDIGYHPEGTYILGSISIILKNRSYLHIFDNWYANSVPDVCYPKIIFLGQVRNDVKNVSRKKFLILRQIIFHPPLIERGGNHPH